MDASVNVPRNAAPAGGPQAADGPEDSPTDTARLLSRLAVIGLFVIAFFTTIAIARAFVLPVTAAFVVGVTIGGPVDRLKNSGFPPWVVAIVVVGLVLSLVMVGAVLLATPLSEWVSKAPDLTQKIKEKLDILGRPLAALQQLNAALSNGASEGSQMAIDLSKGNVIQSVLAFLTPALSELALFFGALLFFLVARTRIKGKLVLSFVDRSHRLMMLRIIANAERDLATYLATATLINLGVGFCVAGVLFVLGVPNAPLWGLLAFFLNYLPYVGPTIMAAILLVVGLVAFPTLGEGLLPAACFVCLTTIEGQFLSPALLGRRLELNPLAVFLGIAFWTWLWGPVGAFLSVPLLVIGMAAWRNMFPPDVVELP